MSTAPAEPNTNEPQANEPPAAATTQTPEPPKPTEPSRSEPKQDKGKQNLWEDPDAAKAEIERLRRENGAARTNAKAQAAEDAKKELAQTIGKALGLVENEPVDPETLTKQVAESQADAKQARVELAVYRNATNAGGDPAALLDSASFLKSLDGIDPSDATAVAEAITKAVEANPRLGAAPSDPKAPAPNPAQGSSASGPGRAAQLTQADLRKMTPEQIGEARKEGRLNDLLGVRT